MATGNSRDVKMTLSVETLGTDEIQKLRDSITKLGDGAGAAAPEFQRLLSEIDQLSDQNKAVQAFTDLSARIEALGSDQAAAAARVEELRAKFDTLSVAARKAGDTQADVAQKFKAAKNELVDAGAAIQKLKADYDAAGKKTQEYKDALSGLIDRQTAAKKSVDETRVANREANTELGKTEAAQQKVTKALEGAVAAQGKIAKLLSEQSRAQAESTATLQALGVASTNAADAQTQLIAAYNKVGAEAQDAKASQDAYKQAMAEVIEEAERLETVLLSGAADKAAADARALADASGLLATEQMLAAEASERQAAAAAEAAVRTERLAAAQRDLDAAQWALAQDTLTRALDEQRLAAQRLIEEEGQLVRAQQEAEVAAREAAAATEAAAQRIDNAFRTLGTRSAQELQREIDQVRAAMVEVRTQAGPTGASIVGAMQAGEAKIAALAREMRELNGQLTLADKASGLLRNSLGQIAAGNLIADAVGAIVERVKDMGRQFFTSNIEIERLTRSLTLITGSTQAAAEKIAFLRDVAKTSGVAVGDITDAFIRFQASATTAGLSAAQVDGVFRSVVNASGQLGLSSDKASLALEALSQIAAKGVVSMEELRGQLGDSLPGALSIAAKGLGVTQGELIKMVESGRLMSTEFFPAFEKGMRETFGEADRQVTGVLAGFNNIKNALKEIAQGAADTSAWKGLGVALQFVADNLKTIVTAIATVGQAFAAIKLFQITRDFLGLGAAATKSAADLGVNTAATVANTTATVANTTAKVASTAAITASGVAAAASAAGMTVFSTVIGRLGTAFTALGTAARAAYAAIGGPVGILITLGLYYKELGTWIGESTAKLLGHGKAVEETERKMAEMEAAEKARATERRRRQEEQDIADARAISKSVEVRKEVEKRAEVDEKAIKTAESQAEASRVLTGLLGNEVAALNNAAESAVRVADAKLKFASTSDAIVLALQAELAAIDKTRDANGALTSAMEEQRKKVVELLASKKEMADRSAGEAEAAKNEAAARRVASEAYKDNSDRLEELGQAAEDARTKLKTLTDAGITDARQLADATREIAVATAIYNDALKDQSKSIEATTKSKVAAKEVDIASLAVALQMAQSDGDEAKRLGNKYLLRESLIKQREIEIKIDRLKLDAQRIEIQSTIELASAKLTELAASGNLTKVKQLEIEAEINLAKAKLKTLEAVGLNIKEREKELDRIKSGIQGLDDEKSALDRSSKGYDTNSTSVRNNTTARERSIEVREKELALAARELELENKRRNVDKEGFSLNTAGQRIVAGGQVPPPPGNAADYEFDEEAANKYLAAWRPLSPLSAPNLTQFWKPTSQANADYMARVSNPSGGGSDPGGYNGNAGYSPFGSYERSKAAPAPAPSSTGSYTVNVTIGGKNYGIGAANKESADTLIRMLTEEFERSGP